MSKALTIDRSKCTECHACELRCSFVHWGVFNDNKSGIRIAAQWPDLPAVRLCRQCIEPACVDACPSGALVRDASGAVHVHRDDCISCEACVTACPYDGIWMDPLTSIAVKCDTCGGRYECVASCMAGALSSGQ